MMAFVFMLFIQSECESLFVTATQNLNDFRNFLALVLFVATRNGVFDTVADMIAENFLFGTAQGRSHRRNLRDNIDAVAAIFNHAGKTTHLALYAFEPFQHGDFGFFLHT